MNQSPYSNRPSESFWKSGVVEAESVSPPGLYFKKWPISDNERIATAGSCFAQHIGRDLKSRDFTVLNVEPAPPRLPVTSRLRFGYDMYSARYGNIYTVRQLLQLTQEALDFRSPGEVVWEKDGRYYDALRPGVEPEGLNFPEEVLSHRAFHLKRVRELLLDMDVFIFTLGLTEAWAHREFGTVYPTAPGTIAGSYDRDKYVFKNFNFGEIYADFREFRKIIQELRGPDQVRYLLTVSPVPLTATASDKHVLVATTYSKSVLRAVAGQLAIEESDIDYFPSFEIISNPWAPRLHYDASLRTVKKTSVQTVMQTFAAAHVETVDGAVPPKTNSPMEHQKVKVELEDEAELSQCEDELLEAFGESHQ